MEWCRSHWTERSAIRSDGSGGYYGRSHWTERSVEKRAWAHCQSRLRAARSMVGQWIASRLFRPVGLTTEQLSNAPAAVPLGHSSPLEHSSPKVISSTTTSGFVMGCEWVVLTVGTSCPRARVPRSQTTRFGSGFTVSEGYGEEGWRHRG